MAPPMDPFVNRSSHRHARSCKHVVSFVTAALACIRGGVAWAGGGAATDAYQGIVEGRSFDVHGVVDLYAQHAFAGGSEGSVLYRAFDTSSERLAVEFVRVTVSHRPDWWGFRLDLGAGETSNAYFHSDPASASSPDSSRWLSYIQQAFVTVVVPMSRGVTFDAGSSTPPVGLSKTTKQ